MKKVILIRHGESVWNKENRFTDGPMWTSPRRVEEAHKAGKYLKKEGFRFEKPIPRT